MHSNKYFLKKIHSTHHKTIAPIAMDYLYVHPLEWFIGYFGPFLAIFLISLFNPVCIASFWFYQIIRNIHEIDVHSGFKSLISSWVPFWGEAEHHDLHHERLDGNYASTFTFWDHIFKTKISK
jgi:methylsterol monooxygenase